MGPNVLSLLLSDVVSLAVVFVAERFPLVVLMLTYFLAIIVVVLNAVCLETLAPVRST